MTRFRRYLPSFGIAIMIVYFSYHALNGDQSVLQWMHHQQDVKALEVQLAQLQDRQAQLEKQNKLLRPGSLDLDYLQERARAKLRYMDPHDRLIAMADTQNH